MVLSPYLHANVPHADPCLGVYLMVFNQCMFVLRKRRSRPSDYLVGTAVSLFILITAVRVSRLNATLSTYLMNIFLAPCHRHPAQYSGFHRRRGSAKLPNHILWHI